MRHLRWLAACLTVVLAAWTAPASAATGPVLVLYTADAKVNYGNGGKLYAIFLRNLVGHFTTDVRIEDAGDASPGEVRDAGAVFFLGFVENWHVSSRLLHALAARKGPTVWFRYGVD